MAFSLTHVGPTGSVRGGKLVAASWQPGGAAGAPMLCGFLYQNGTFRLWNAVTNEHWTYQISFSTHDHTHWTSVRLAAPRPADSGRVVTAIFLGEDPHTAHVAVIDLASRTDADTNHGGGGGAVAAEGGDPGCLVLATSPHKGFVTCIETRNLGPTEFLTACSDGSVFLWAVVRASGNERVRKRSVRLQRRFSAPRGAADSGGGIQAVAACGSTVVAVAAGPKLWVYDDPDKRGPLAQPPAAGGGGSDPHDHDGSALLARAIDLAAMLPGSKPLGAVCSAVAYDAAAPSALLSGLSETAPSPVATGVRVVLGTECGTFVVVPLDNPPAYRALSFPGQPLNSVDAVVLHAAAGEGDGRAALATAPSSTSHATAGGEALAVLGSCSGWVRLCRVGAGHGAMLEVVGFVRMADVVRCELRPGAAASATAGGPGGQALDHAPLARGGVTSSLLAASADGGIRVWAPDQLPLCEDGVAIERPRSPVARVRPSPAAAGAFGMGPGASLTPSSVASASASSSASAAGGAGGGRGAGSGHFPRTAFGSREKMDAMAHAFDDEVAAAAPSPSSLATPQLQSQRLVAASIDVLDARLDRLPAAAARVALDDDIAAAVRRVAANDVVNYAPQNRRYRGLVPLDASDDERRHHKHRSPASVTDASSVTAAAQVRAARAMAEAMADDDDHMADAGGGDEHAACDALALAQLREDDADWDMTRLQADGAMAMSLLLSMEEAEDPAVGW